MGITNLTVAYKYLCKRMVIHKQPSRKELQAAGKSKFGQKGILSLRGHTTTCENTTRFAQARQCHHSERLSNTDCCETVTPPHQIGLALGTLF